MTDNYVTSDGKGNFFEKTATQQVDGSFTDHVQLTGLPGLDIPAHDYISCSYTGSDLTGVVYKTGGSGGTTVAMLTLAYTDGKLVSVTKS